MQLVFLTKVIEMNVVIANIRTRTIKFSYTILVFGFKTFDTKVGIIFLDTIAAKSDSDEFNHFHK